jgi:hypothetical protein
MSAKAEISKEENSVVEQKPSPPLERMSAWAMMWLWGALLLYTPIYLNVTGTWQAPFNVLGLIAIIISFGGAVIELGKLRKNDGFKYWGVSLVFLLPALLLHLGVAFRYIVPPWDTVAKIAVLILIAIGGPLLFLGLPYMFWKPTQNVAEISPQQLAEQKEAKRKTDINTIVSAIIALLSLLTAIVKFVADIKH